MRAAFLLCYVTLTCLGQSADRRQPAHPLESRGPRDLLQMQLVRNFGPNEVPRFRLELHNADAQGMFLEIGEMWGNGRAQELTKFRYLLREPSGRLVGLTWPGPASSMGQPAPDPLTVPLPPDATISLPIDFATLQMQQGDRADWRIHLVPGRYEFWVEFTETGISPELARKKFAGIPLVPYWVGTVRTEPIEFVVTRQR